MSTRQISEEHIWFGSMAGTNIKVIRDAFKEFKKETDEATLKWVETYAQAICYKAIEFRKKNPMAHDFTGNLLNSIVAAVYYKKEFKRAFFSGESGIRQPRYYEMTASHKKGHYHFKIDYSGAESNYTAVIETLRRKGIDDAYEFVSAYTPQMSGYVVVVAYTTDYASWVEAERQTTGFLNTYRYAEKLGMNFFQLPNKAA